MALTRKDFNKSIQVFSRLVKLHSLIMGCYEWNRQEKKFVPARDFQEKFDLVIKASQELKRHKPVQIVVARMADLKFTKEKTSE